MRRFSKISPDWWDYTTLDEEILEDAGRLSEKDILELSRPGFKVKFYENLETLYSAEAMEYIKCWKDSTPDNPTGICGPIGPTEQLPIVARMINDLEIDIRGGYYWGMDEWFVDGKEMSDKNPLSFKKAFLELCLSRIDKRFRMPDENIFLIRADNIKEFSDSFDKVKCLIMQGGQGDAKHWAFNDPFKRRGNYKDNPPTSEEYMKLGSRLVELHPMTIMQNARTSGGGAVYKVPTEALTVGPVETFKSGKVSIWLAGNHDNQFGIRLTSMMISKKIIDTSVPMSLLAEHPDVEFNIYRPAVKSWKAEMH